MVEIPAPDLGTASEWSLVLYARGITHRLVVTPTRIAIVVEAGRLNEALGEINAYQEENRTWGQWEHGHSRALREVEGTVLACVLLFSFFSLLLSGKLHHTLVSIGANQGDKVLEGHQFWRPITALTLHQDPSHLLSNMVIGGVFVVLLVQFTGAPLAWVITFAAGVSGNVLSLLIRGDSAAGSIGASTSVFGALGGITGVLLVMSIMVRGHFKRPIIYLGTGLALLSFLGVGDRFTDRTAHLMGFLAGAAMGALIGGIGPERARKGLEHHAPTIYVMLVLTLLGAWYVGMVQTGTSATILTGLRQVLLGT